MKIAELFEARKTESFNDLFDSVRNGRFTLDGSDMIFQAGFNCTAMGLTTLIGTPSKIHGDFSCNENLLKNLNGGPKIVDDWYYCAHNSLTSLDGICAAVGALGCTHNHLTSLQGIHKQIESIKLYADFRYNPIKSHVLGLLKIKSLKKVSLDNEKVMEIINFHLPEGDIIECQRDLIEAGFEEYAQL